MGNLLMRTMKQWYAQSKQKGAVRDVHPPPDPDMYYEFEFVIDTPALKTVDTEKAHVDPPGTECGTVERVQHDDGVQRERGE